MVAVDEWLKMKYPKRLQGNESRFNLVTKSFFFFLLFLVVSNKGSLSSPLVTCLLSQLPSFSSQNELLHEYYTFDEDVRIRWGERERWMEIEDSLSCVWMWVQSLLFLVSNFLVSVDPDGDRGWETLPTETLVDLVLQCRCLLLFFTLVDTLRSLFTPVGLTLDFHKVLFVSLERSDCCCCCLPLDPTI